MNPADLLLAALIVAALAWAVWRCVRNVKSGKNCCGNCSACTAKHTDCKEFHT